MKFGKVIQSQQVPGWSTYYLDYKFLKKIISSLAANRPAFEAAALARGVKPQDILLSSLSAPGSQLASPIPATNVDSNNQSTNTSGTGALSTTSIAHALSLEASLILPPPSIVLPPSSTTLSPLSLPDPTSVSPPSAVGIGAIQNATGGNMSVQQQDARAHKAAFFFKLERELEKINTFYLQKEAELKLRLETLLSKRRAAAMRGLPEHNGDSNVEWSAVAEGFRLLERDLRKLQQFVEINATGFRKILKKFDKRSKSTTKELYLARQVDVQPVFNRQLISELSDAVAACLLDLTDLSSGLKFEGPAANDIFTQQILAERPLPVGPFYDLEHNLRKAVQASDRIAIENYVRLAEVISHSHAAGDTNSQASGRDSTNTNVTRILWNLIIEAPPDLADLILVSLSTPFDFRFIDDINGRTCLHEAAIAGTPRLVDMCLINNVQHTKQDTYGRTASHYAAMHGHAEILRKLLKAGVPPNSLDRDNYTPLIYATLKGSEESVKVLLDEGSVPVGPVTNKGTSSGTASGKAGRTSSSDLIPLSLAAQSGHVGVVTLLLSHGAQCISNTNGEYPMHLAVREGHTPVCKLLLNLEGWDTPDKYHEWTPLFHAARYGRDECVELLVNNGARLGLVDELGHLPVHYAAWYGNHGCLSKLLNAVQVSNEIGGEGGEFAAGVDDERAGAGHNEDSPMSDIQTRSDSQSDSQDQASPNEIDMIPSLSLPPPIMPHRVYGHNYLDRQHLVQVTIGHHRSHSLASQPTATSRPGVRLHHRLINPSHKDEYLLATAPLKLVMTCPSVTSAPFSVSLPVNHRTEDEDGGAASGSSQRTPPASKSAEVTSSSLHLSTTEGLEGTFVFQVPSLDVLSLEFSIHPNFGAKTLGRAVALPSLFGGVSSSMGRGLFPGSFKEPVCPSEIRGFHSLPILDNRLHVVGEVDFEVNIITAFQGATLEVGGDVETYWKSLGTSSLITSQLSTPRWPHRSSLISSAHTSPFYPTTASNNALAPSLARPLTISSLHGNFLSIIVQVTRDLQPVVYTGQLLPESNFELTVADVTLVQFEALARRVGKYVEYNGYGPANIALNDWPTVVETSMISLTQLLKILPANLGISVDLAYAHNSPSHMSSINLNAFVDSVLQTIYHASSASLLGSPAASAGGYYYNNNHVDRRRIVFTSSSPDVCAALNWKQPNYPVFFASLCGKHTAIRGLAPMNSIPSLLVNDNDNSNSNSSNIATPNNNGHQSYLDYRNLSVGAAVEFARTNNLLGIFVDADLLVQVPSLIQGIRNAGLLVGVYGSYGHSLLVNSTITASTNTVAVEGGTIDAYLGEGMVMFVDHTPNELF